MASIDYCWPQITSTPAPGLVGGIHSDTTALGFAVFYIQSTTLEYPLRTRSMRVTKDDEYVGKVLLRTGWLTRVIGLERDGSTNSNRAAGRHMILG